MKLVKIYSNKHFKNIEFDSRFNVVLATIHEKNKKTDTHNLGKTYLIHVINFLLLSSFDKKVFENLIFVGVVFYCEIELNNGEFIIIRREIDKHSKISFLITKEKSPNYIPPKIWNEENIPLEKAKKRLNDLLGFDVVKNFDFRKSITYFLRTQQDYSDVFKLNKFLGKDVNWKPFVFELLGYDSNLIIKKSLLEKDIADKNNIIKTLTEEARINVKDRDTLASLLDIKEQEVIDTKSSIDRFNFYLKDNNLNKELIEVLENNIQILNVDKYRISYEISKITDSLQNINNDININELEKLHKEVKLYFPEEIKKDFEDLVKFNEAISKERKQYLTENLQDLNTELSLLNKELKQLELEKSEKLSFLIETDSYSKFKEYQKELSKAEAEVERIKDKIKSVDSSIDIENEIQLIKKEVEESIVAIRDAIHKRKHSEINRIFNLIILEILGTNATISIKQNKQGNIDFSADYQNQRNLDTTLEANGTSYKKLLCMAFDLSLLIHYSKNSFFRFVYHDGILEGFDDRVKIRLINKIKEICNEYNLQYIISMIDSDIPMNETGSRYEFTQNEICLELNDKDDSGKLFLNSF